MLLILSDDIVLRKRLHCFFIIIVGPHIIELTSTFANYPSEAAFAV